MPRPMVESKRSITFHQREDRYAAMKNLCENQWPFVHMPMTENAISAASMEYARAKGQSLGPDFVQPRFPTPQGLTDRHY
jgi:hypothetical protein